MDSNREMDPEHQVPEGVDEKTLRALGVLSKALETTERARGHLYGFHQLTGTADFELGDAVRLLREAGHEEQAARVERELGRGWHQIEDFYSHSNWSDRPAPGPVGLDNPPGLERTDVAPFLDIRRYSAMKDADWTRDARERVPADLATGCYTDIDSTGVKPADCDGRVTHNRALNKDTAASPRSKTGDNFRHATAGATAEITRQWNDFKAELTARYPDHRRGAQMVCALVHDEPAGACP